jgi:hypothetical protein
MCLLTLAILVFNFEKKIKSKYSNILQRYNTFLQTEIHLAQDREEVYMYINRIQFIMICVCVSYFHGNIWYSVFMWVAALCSNTVPSEG